MAKTPTPIEAFLAPLAKLAHKYPEVEAEVIWANGAAWEAQDDESEYLDAEEVPVYAEGLMIEGFHLHYQVLAEAETPKEPAHIRLFFWQQSASEPPEPEAGLCLYAAGHWPG